jgi:tRNA (guanine37-N1)-methyltransferase
MRIDVISLFPEMIRQVTEYGVTGKAAARGLLQLVTWNPRDYTRDRHRSVDDRPYGGGPGMVMSAQPVCDAIGAARADGGEASVIYLSPQGAVLDQAAIQNFAARSRLVLLCGRYEGIDERVVDLEVDEEWSLGDYVLSGGELAAMVVIDAVTRLLPDVLGDEDSAEQDSFSNGLLDCPHYTRPETFAGMRVPEVLLGGHHAEIERWRHKQALGRTWLRRPELLAKRQLTEEDAALLAEFVNAFDASQ